MAVTALSQNLLQNPGFETWTGNMPNYWHKDDSIVVSPENQIVHAGNFSVQDSLITQNQDRADFFQGPFAIGPNIQYTFSIWVYDNDAAGKLRQLISWHTSSGWTNTYASNYSSNANVWQQLTLTVLSPAGADSAIVFVRAYDSSAAWDGAAVFYLDEAAFIPSATQAPVIARVWHKPTNPGANVVTSVYAKVSDDGTILADTIFYGVGNLTNPWKMAHTAVASDTFRYLVPGQAWGDTIFYYLKFIDDDGLSAISDTHAYFVGAFNTAINEVYYDPPGQDSGAFIELHGPGNASLNGMSLVGVNGLNGADYGLIDLSGHSIPTDGFFVVGQNYWVSNADTVTANADLQNGPDNLELRFNGITIDALGYGTLNGWVFTGEWEPAVDVADGHSLGRYPDGHDTDNNLVDFLEYDTITPGMPNPELAITEDRAGSRLNLSVRNPVVSGIKFVTIIRDENMYPVRILNSLGQQVKVVTTPHCMLDLPSGVYFLQLNSFTGQNRKLIVVK